MKLVRPRKLGLSSLYLIYVGGLYEYYLPLKLQVCNYYGLASVAAAKVQK